MKENRIFTVAVAVIAMILLLLSLGRFLGENKPEKYKISIVVDRSSSASWDSFRRGLNAAVKQYNMEYNFVTTSRFSSIQQEYASLTREVKNGTDGIITELRATEGTGEILDELGKQVKIALVESERENVRPDLFIPTFSVDEEALGTALGTEVLQSSLQAEKLSIGILAGNQSKGNMKKRLDALKKVLESGEQEIAWVIEDRGQYRKDLDEESHRKSVDVIIALDNDSLEAAAHYTQETGRSFIELYGVGDSEEVIYDLDTGVIRSLIVIDHYDMAYSAVEALWKQLSGGQKTGDTHLVDFYVVKAGNMYSKKMERILFPTD